MGDTNLDNLQPITSFTLRFSGTDYTYTKLEDGRVQRTDPDGFVEYGNNENDLIYQVWQSRIDGQSDLINFFKAQQNELNQLCENAAQTSLYYRNIYIFTPRR